MSQKYKFDTRIKELLASVGGGSPLKGRVVVDQPYAQVQHEDLSFFHPRGGKAKYLEEPLLSNADSYLRNVARTALQDGGADGMSKAMERLSTSVSKLAPVEFGDLRRSGHPIVKSGARIVYDRPPEKERLTEAEMAAKDAIRGMI